MGVMKGRRVAWLGLLLVVLSGCFSGRPVTQYYSLALRLPPADAAAQRSETLLVGRFNARDPYAQGRLVYRPGDFKLGYYNYHVWGSLPAEQLGEWTVRWLRATGRFPRVVSLSEGAADLVLGATLREFDEIDRGDHWDAALAIDFWLARPDQVVPPWLKSYRRECRAERRNPEAIAKALSRCLEGVLSELSQELPAAIATLPALR